MFVQIIFVFFVLNCASAQGTIKKEYKLETYFKANWYDASTFCRDHGMQLATVNSNDEAIDINKLLPGMEAERIWISASDLGQDGLYKWFSTGKTLSSYSYWDYGQPIELYQYQEYQPDAPPPPKIDNIQDCVQISGQSTRWESADCNTLNYFICETL